MESRENMQHGEEFKLFLCRCNAVYFLGKPARVCIYPGLRINIGGKISGSSVVKIAPSEFANSL